MKYIKNAVFALPLLFSIHTSYGMEQGTPNDNNQPGTLLADKRMPPELLHEIFHYLSHDDLKSVRKSSKFGNTQVAQYIEEQLLLATRQLDTLNPRMSSDQIGCILSTLGERDKKTLFGLLETKMNENQFLLAVPKSPMAFHLYTHPGFKPLKAGMMLDHIEDAKALYRALFNCDFPTDNPSSTKIALDHLLAAWPLQTVFFKDGNEAHGASAFFKTHTQKLIGKLASLGTEKPYVSFMNHGASLAQMSARPHNIIVSSEQLMDPNAKVILEQLHEQNPEHTIVLSVGEGPFVIDGCLELCADDLPHTLMLMHLRLVNPSGDITTIGNELLREHASLTSLDLSGLTNVKTIKSGFLLGCEALPSIDLSGLINVTTIESGFLIWCSRLTSIDLSGLKNIINIGAQFLEYCPLDEESKRKVEAFLEQVKSRAK